LVVLGTLLLLGVTTYVSALAFALPLHSRARLSERLPDAIREQRLAWLDRHEWELQTQASFLRLLAALGVIGGTWMYFTRTLERAGSVGTVVEVGLVSLLLLAVFAVALPHAIAVHAGEGLLARNFAVLRVAHVLLWPFGRFCAATEFVVRRLLGKDDATEAAETQRVAQEILEAVSEGEAAGAVDEEKKEMIESVFELDQTPVSAIMTPRTDIDAIPATATYAEARDTIVRTGHSRLPVYEGSIDHIIGVLYAKDLLRLDPGEPFDARRIMRAAPYVPETKTLDELLEEFRTTKVQIAIVLDEYGGTAGLATIEDILEELVGEIDDEYDQAPPPTLNRLDEDTLEVDARMHIRDINEELGVNLPEEADYETIGGFVFATLGKIPAAGEEFTHENVRFRVVEAEPRRIKRLRIHVQRARAESV